jgi:hypothetical protein
VLIVPVLGVRLQVTAVLLVFPTTAENCWVCEETRETADGVRLTVTGRTSVTVAEEAVTPSAALVAVTVTVCWLVMAAGAV